ncbi:MAG TPA: hypothetical protein VNW52_13100 [Burkholderiaceae bacterium]|nr:hypothetical protein [Burkholderiaceae bacterium]
MASDILWGYRCFLSSRGDDVIDEWLSTISKKGKAKLERTLEHLCVQPKTEWDRPHASSLGHHIYVIRFKDETGMQHRVFGHFHDKEKTFALTLTGFEKDDKYHPSDYHERATDNKSICDASYPSRTKECFVLAAHKSALAAALIEGVNQITGVNTPIRLTRK